MVMTAHKLHGLAVAYGYFENDSSASISVGIDGNDSDKLKLSASSSVDVNPTTAAQLTIDPGANGDIVLIPNGTGTVNIDYATQNTVSIYGASGALSETAVGTNGQIIIGATAAAPAFATLTSADASIAFVTGVNTLDLTTGGAVAISFATDAGTATPAAGVLTVTGGTNVATAGAGSTVTINFDGILPMIWSVETNAAVVGVVDHGFIANRAGLITITLPTTAAIGSIIEVTGINTAVGWRIAQNAGETIHFGNQSTTTGVGGYLESTEIRDSVRIVCVVANTDWNVLSSLGNITVV